MTLSHLILSALASICATYPSCISCECQHTIYTQSTIQTNATANPHSHNITIYIKQTGLSPLANKPAFLALDAGFTVMLNVIRPARFALSIAISPYFERIRNFFQRKFGVSPRGATVLMVVFVNFIGTCTLMGLGVGMASLLSGVPVWGGL